MEKMEGIVMKNIQERAKEYADRHKAAEIIGKVYGYERIYNAEMAAYERGATDQKAIDDAGLYKLKERREKEAQINHDRDIKSIKERAKLASEDYACDDSYSAGFFTGYVEGATKQKAIDEEVRLKKSESSSSNSIVILAPSNIQYIFGASFGNIESSLCRDQAGIKDEESPLGGHACISQ